MKFIQKTTDLPKTAHPFTEESTSSKVEKKSNSLQNVLGKDVTPDIDCYKKSCC